MWGGKVLLECLIQFIKIIMIKDSQKKKKKKVSVAGKWQNTIRLDDDKFPSFIMLVLSYNY